MKHSLANAILVYLICSLFFSGCAQMSAGEPSDILRKSTMFVNCTKDNWVGYYITDTLATEVSVIIENGKQVITMTRLDVDYAKSQLEKLRSMRLAWTPTTWAAIPYAVKSAVGAYAIDLMTAPIGAPMIIAPMPMFVTPTVEVLG